VGGECTQLVIDISDQSIDQVFSFPDDVKFRSSMTLFAVASDDSPIFRAALDKYYGGELDALTLDLLR